MNNGNSAMASKVQANGRAGIVSAAEAAATLTPAFLAKVEKTLADVQYIRTACGLLGIARRTFYHWKRAGAALRDEIPLDQLDARQRVLVDFCNAVERGIAQGELRDLDTITQAARSNWRAAAWRLERRAPQRWGARRHAPALNRGQIKRLVVETLAEFMSPQDEEESAKHVEAAERRSPASATGRSLVADGSEAGLRRDALAAIATPEGVDCAVLAPRGGKERRGLDALVNDLSHSLAAARR